MQFTFKISESDFLTFQLYTLTKSENVKRKMKRGRIFATLLGAILAFNLLISHALYAGGIMMLGVVLIYIYYPKYHKWRMKSNFKKFIRRNYRDRFGVEEELHILPTGVLSKNISGEGEISKAELTQLVEIPSLFLLGMRNGSSIILPKAEKIDSQKLKSELKKIGIDYKAELDWKY